MTEIQMWQEYTMLNPNATQYEAWAFGGTTDDMPNILAELVLNGTKTATASLHYFYQLENEPLPKVGSYNIILNTNNEAVCITKTTNVYTTPFLDVSVDHAFKEGEGDRSLTYWREVHREFFAKDLSSMGITFSDSMLVVCEEFEVVYPTPINI